MEKHTSKFTTGSPDRSGFSCAMVLTAYSALSPVTGLFCHRGITGLLDISVGISGPHAFAVRSNLTRLLKLPRPSHPALHVRDDA
jgi:hypothetical protein